MKKKHDVKKIKTIGFSANPRKIFVLFLFIVSQIVFLYSDSFRLKELNITGINNLKGEDVVASSAIPWGEFLWKINSSEIHDRVASLNWVKSSQIQKSFPCSLNIHILEREPSVAITQKDDKSNWYGADADGRVLLKLTEEEANKYPKLITDEKIILDTITEKNKIQNIIAVAQLLPPELKNKISFFDIDTGGYLSFMYTSNNQTFEVIFCNISEIISDDISNENSARINAEIAKKTEDLTQISLQFKNKISTIEHIDLRNPKLYIIRQISPVEPENAKKSSESDKELENQNTNKTED